MCVSVHVCAGVFQEESRPDAGLGCLLNHSGSCWAQRERQVEISWGLRNPGWVFLALAIALQLFLTAVTCSRLTLLPARRRRDL